MATTTTEKANIKGIFGAAIADIAQDLIQAKENGQQLPGILNDIAGLAVKAKSEGIDIAKATLKEKLKDYAPYIVAGILGIVVIVMIMKNKS